MAGIGDHDVVLDAYADAAQLFGHQQVGRLEVDARLDGDHHARLQDAIAVVLAAGLGAVVHVEAQVVAGAMHHPAAVLPTDLGIKRFGRADGEQAPLSEVLCDDGDGRLVHVGELGAWPGGLHTCPLGGQHRVVDLALGWAEASGHRQRPGDVGGEQAVEFDSGVQQQQVAFAQVTVVANPVQGVGVVAGRRDGVVAHCVALMTGMQTEDPLDPALTASVGQRVRQFPDDGLEAHRRCPARLPQLLDLVSVLDQAEFT